MDSFYFFLGFISGIIACIIALLWIKRMVDNHQLRPRGASGENSIVENGETIILKKGR